MLGSDRGRVVQDEDGESLGIGNAYICSQCRSMVVMEVIHSYSGPREVLDLRCGISLYTGNEVRVAFEAIFLHAQKTKIDRRHSFNRCLHFCLVAKIWLHCMTLLHSTIICKPNHILIT